MTFSPLPMCPADAIPISSVLSMISRDGATAYFVYLQPIYSHADADHRARNRMIGQFVDGGLASAKEIIAAFGVSRATVTRAVRRLREEGDAGFHKPRKPRSRTAIDGSCAAEAGRLRSEGLSIRRIAKLLGLSQSTLHRHFQEGRIPGWSPGGTPALAAGEAAEVLDKAARNGRDAEAPMGMAAHDVAGRVAASVGGMAEVQPRFEAASAVACGGVLTALPALLENGLFRHAAPGLPKGYYGAATMLLFLCFLFLARLRAPEHLRFEAPGEWGALLGLDRCPEVKTLRRKLQAFSSDEQAVGAWQAALARDWAARDPELAASLCVDGHVKVYAGRKGHLPKHFVPRQKLCLPAATSYWIHALDGAPFLCLHQEVDPGMVRILRETILPELHEMGVLPAEADPAAPALTLVFDREGWSPALFRHLASCGIACITWRKGRKQPDWPADEFSRHAVPLHGPGGMREAPALLAERTVTLPNGLDVREIRRLTASGHQAPVITTHPGMSTAEIAGAMFSRWSQENWFKTMRTEFDLDAMPEHALAAVDDDTQVVNPVRRALDKALGRLRGKATVLRNRLFKAGKQPTTDALLAQLAEVECEIGELAGKRRSIPKHVAAGSLDETQRLDALPQPMRRFCDTLRMIAYRAETAMMPCIAKAQGKKRNPRAALRALFSTEATILPDYPRKTLTIRILHLANKAHSRHLRPLLETLNATKTVFPGTDLTMLYELASDIDSENPFERVDPALPAK